MARAESDDAPATSLRRHGLLVAGICVGVVLGLGLWASLTEIAGAVVASGTVAVEGGHRRVQHAEGGTVAEILVEDGQTVREGQLLVRLQGTAIEAALAVIVAQLDDALARKARLVAESSGAAEMLVPTAPGWSAGPSYMALFDQQRPLLDARRMALSQQAAALEEQANQVQQQIEGLGGLRHSKAEQLEILELEWQGLEELSNNGLAAAARVNSNKTQRAALEGEIASIEADIAEARAGIAELRLNDARSLQELRAGVLQELQQTNAAIAELLQQRIAAQDRLSHLEIRAPAAGVVHETIVETVGGVVGAGEVLMQIVPSGRSVFVEARVSPMDIDRVVSSQDVTLKFPGLNSRTTSDIRATVSTVPAATSWSNSETMAPYYAVQIDIPDPEMSRLPPGTQLMPGMPVEAYIETGTRTVADYLLRPILDSFSSAFRDD